MLYIILKFIFYIDFLLLHFAHAIFYTWALQRAHSVVLFISLDDS